MHLVAVINSLAGGGAERVLCALLAHWVREPGLSITLVLLDDLPQRYAVPAGVRLEVLDAKESMWRSCLRLTQAIRRLRPDVVLSYLTRSNVATVIATRGMRIPTIISERVNTTSHFSSRGLSGVISRWMVRRYYPRATRVLAVSRGVADDLRGNFGIPKGIIEVIENPYDLELLRQRASEAPSIDLPERYLVAVGRLTANKNYPLMLRALAGLDHKLHLVVLGEGEQHQNLQVLARELGVAGRVKFVGYLSNPHAIVARAAAYVSTSNAEGFPNAAAEAMVIGVPVIMTDCPSGPAELLLAKLTAPGDKKENDAGACGWLIPMNDVDALVTAVRSALNDGASERVERAKCRMEPLRVDAVAKRYLQMIEHVRFAVTATATLSSAYKRQ